MGPLKVFDYDTWTWRDATPVELKKQEEIDKIRYREPEPEPENPRVERVEVNGKKYIIFKSNFGQIGKAEVSDDLRKYIADQVGKAIKE